MNKLDLKFNELRHSIGDVVEAIQEQMWSNKWQQLMYAGYRAGTDEELGKAVKNMIDEELYRIAEELCDE